MIEVYADTSCPFAHVGLRMLANIREDRSAAGLPGFEVRVRTWPLELVNGHPLDATMTARKVRALRDQVVGDMFRSFSALAVGHSTLVAMALEERAYSLSPDSGFAVSLQLRDIVFEQGQPLTEQRLTAIAAEHRLPLPDAAEALEMAQLSLAEGQARGVQGSPLASEPICPMQHWPRTRSRKPGVEPPRPVRSRARSGNSAHFIGRVGDRWSRR